MGGTRIVLIGCLLLHEPLLSPISPKFPKNILDQDDFNPGKICPICLPMTPTAIAW